MVVLVAVKLKRENLKRENLKREKLKDINPKLGAEEDKSIYVIRLYLKDY